MKFKITIDCGDIGFWQIEDIKDFYNDVLNDEGKVFADKYFTTGEFTDEWLEENNGKHFLFGYLESLCQSDECPGFLFNNNIKTNKYIVEKLK